MARKKVLTDEEAAAKFKNVRKNCMRKLRLKRRKETIEAQRGKPPAANGTNAGAVGNPETLEDYASDEGGPPSVDEAFRSDSDSNMDISDKEHENQADRLCNYPARKSIRERQRGEHNGDAEDEGDGTPLEWFLNPRQNPDEDQADDDQLEGDSDSDGFPQQDAPSGPESSEWRAAVTAAWAT